MPDIEDLDEYDLKKAVIRKSAEAHAFPYVYGESREELLLQAYQADQLKRLKEDYEHKSDKLALWEAVEYSRQVGFEVPAWVQSILSDLWRLYKEEKGLKTFDELLGLRPKRGRAGHLLQQKESADKKGYISYYIKRLHQYFRFSLPVTYFLLNKSGIEAPFNYKSEPRMYFSKDYLEEIYNADKSLLDFDEPEPGESKLSDFFEEGYSDMLFSNEAGLKEAGLYDSAIRTLKKILQG